MNPLDALLHLALDLNAALTAQDRYDRLLNVVRQVIPCDAAALLRWDGEALVPMAAYGLSPAVLSRSFAPAAHPRLAEICRSLEPVRFLADDPRPDPFQGLLLERDKAWRPIHDCLGCPLWQNGELKGALTADSVDPRAFDGVEGRLLAALGALAGAAMRTSEMIESLEGRAQREGWVAREVMRDCLHRHGRLLLGRSAEMARLSREIELVARSGFAVLVTGETGAGKELVAREIHEASDRRGQPMLYVNCAALPESLAESELFGHTRGAFTGAAAERPGKFEVASGGTLLLDEVGELPPMVQPKLLRALQHGEIQRVGADRPRKVDVRILALTNRDLVGAVAAGHFRADLYHRLNVFPLRVPALRERLEDIPLLAEHFAEHTRRRLRAGPVRFSPEVFPMLQAYHWPGNVRELENVISRAVLRASAGVAPGGPVLLAPELLSLELGPAMPEPRPEASAQAMEHEPGLPFRQAVEEYQRRLIRQALHAHGGKWAATARALGLQRSNLHHLARRLGLR